MIGDHSITAGIDNQDSHDLNDGASIAGPELGGTGYELWYAKGDPTKNISATRPLSMQLKSNYPGGQTGYYGPVSTATTPTRPRSGSGSGPSSSKTTGKPTDNTAAPAWLAHSTSSPTTTPRAPPYLRLTKPQWAPRLGATWDVNGDSTLKIYGNAGRYDPAMPASVALRTASGLAGNTTSTSPRTGIDANGEPTGGHLHRLNHRRRGFAQLGEIRTGPRDPKNGQLPRTSSSKYQDEFILGFDAALTDKWTYGAKATVRKLRNSIDDVGDSGAIEAKMIRSGSIRTPSAPSRAATCSTRVVPIRSWCRTPTAASTAST